MLYGGARGPVSLCRRGRPRRRHHLAVPAVPGRGCLLDPGVGQGSSFTSTFRCNGLAPGDSLVIPASNHRSLLRLVIFMASQKLEKLNRIETNPGVEYWRADVLRAPAAAPPRHDCVGQHVVSGRDRPFLVK